MLPVSFLNFDPAAFQKMLTVVNFVTLIVLATKFNVHKRLFYCEVYLMMY